MQDSPVYRRINNGIIWMKDAELTPTGLNLNSFAIKAGKYQVTDIIPLKGWKD